MIKSLLFLFFSFVLCISSNAKQIEERDALTIYVFELKPLVYTDKNEIKGSWYESFERLAKLANLKFNYEFVSVSRLELLLESTDPGCNLTLLKTKPRIERNKVNFIFEHPVKTILKTYQRADDKRRLTLKELQENPSLVIISNTPVALDALKEKGIKAEMHPKINSIVQMLVSTRMDVFAGSNLAIEAMDEFKSGRLKEGIVLKTLTHGIGCSRGTPPVIIERLKKAAKHWQL